MTANDLVNRLAGVRAKAAAGHQPLPIDVDAADLGDAEDLRQHHDADRIRPDARHTGPKPPPAAPIPEHLRRYLVSSALTPPWRDDYSHDPQALDDTGKRPRYPGGRCVRLYCWPCRVAELDAGEPRTWDGVARMARARQAAGRPLDDLDREALKRTADQPIAEG